MLYLFLRFGAGERGKYNKMNIQYCKQVKVRTHVDVLVIGGGPAGVAAAVTAARIGKSVYLAEKTECFGGAGTISKVPAFMRFSDGVHFLSGGIGREIFSSMYGEESGVEAIEFPIDTERLKIVYDQMMENSGAQFSFDTTLIDVVAEHGRIEYAILQGKEELFAVSAEVFIDATGNGTLAFLAGADYEKGDKDGNMMPATLCSVWDNIDWNRAVVELGKDPDNRFLKQAIEDGVFSVPDTSLPGMWHLQSGYGGGNIGHIFGVDGTDERSLTKGMIEARKRMSEYKYYYNNYLSGYENSNIISTADVLGIRETRRIVCEYMASKDDYLSFAKFEDEIGRYCYPIDIHAYSISKKTDDDDMYSKGYPKGKSYGISYKSLIPKGLKNLLIAGRCVGAERSMMGSMRVMPVCYITGMAAGAAAAMSADESDDVRNINICTLRKVLREQGVYLP